MSHSQLQKKIVALCRKVEGYKTLLQRRANHIALLESQIDLLLKEKYQQVQQRNDSQVTSELCPMCGMVKK